MIDGFLQSTFFGITLTLAAYVLGGFVFKKTKHPLCTPIMIAVIVIIAVLKVFHIPYEYYAKGSEIIGLFLGPATACLAVNIYEKRLLLKKWWIPVLCGCLAGTLTSITSVLIICRIFGLSPAVTVALLPKSVTTPIAAAISGAQGGIVPITFLLFIVFALIAEFILRRTQYGRNMFLVGGNINVADNLGIHVRGYIWSGFIVNGFCAALAGVFMMTRMFSASGNLALDGPLNVIPMVIVGGTAMSGGKGGAICTLFGALLMNIIYNGMTMFSIPATIQELVKGMILLIIIVSDKYMEHRHEKI